MITDQQRIKAFYRCRTVPGLDPNLWRMDAAGAIIRKTSQGSDDTLYGWEMDHIIPQSLLEEHNVPEELIDHDDNLRALNWNNNRSKTDNYPSYNSVVTSDEDGSSNIFIEEKKTVNKARQAKLRDLYKDYFKNGEI